MGLDMYLNRRIYVWSEQRGSLKITGLKSKVRPDNVKFIVEEAGYWRKANAIHKWFVQNVQDGNDNCKEYYVSKESMQKLLDTVNKVLEASELVDGNVITEQYQNDKAESYYRKGQVLLKIRQWLGNYCLRLKGSSLGVLIMTSITMRI